MTSGVLSSSIGTSGVLFAHSDQPQVDPLGRLHTFCHAVRGKWHLMGVVLSAGGSLQWFRNQLCQAEIAAAKKSKVDPYVSLGEEAAKTPVGSQGLIFLPYLPASAPRTPILSPRSVRRPDARAYPRASDARRDGRRQLRPARQFGDYAGMRRAREANRGFGGGARSPLWRQIQADVLGQKVVSINVEEGPAYGAALLAAVGGGAFKDVPEACSATIRVVKQTSVKASSQKYYDAGFQVYQDLYRSLRDDFRKLAALDA